MLADFRPPSLDGKEHKIHRDKFYMPLNVHGHMILKGYTIVPELLEAFKMCCAPSHCAELAAVIYKGLQPTIVIRRMKEISKYEGSTQTWQETEEGSFDNIISRINEFGYKHRRDGSYSRYETYYTIDPKIFVQGHIPGQRVWEIMTAIADRLLDRDVRCREIVKLEHLSRRSPVPDQEKWAQIRNGKLLYPRIDGKGEWVYVPSSGATMDGKGPLTAAKSSGHNTDNALLNGHPLPPQISPGTPLLFRDQRDFRGPSRSRPPSLQFEDIPASPPLSPELPFRSCEVDIRGGQGRCRSYSRRRYLSPFPDGPFQGRHRDEMSTPSSSKSRQKKGKMYLWRKHGKTGLSWSKR